MNKKPILIAINVIFLIISGVIILCGDWIRTLLDSRPEIGESLPLDVPLVVILIGVISMGISLLGMFATSTENTVLLLIMCIFLGLLSVLKIALLLVVYFEKEGIATLLNKLFKEEIVQYSIFNKKVAFIDLSQFLFKCCGASYYGDWSANQGFSCDSTGPFRCSVPITCCNRETSLSLNCAENVLSENTTNIDSIYQQGCTNTLINYIYSNVTWIYVGVALIILFEVLVLMMMATFRAQTNALKKKISVVKKQRHS